MKRGKAIRWSGEGDRYWWRFTYSRDRHSRLGIILGSGDNDDYPGCRLRLHLFGHTLIAALPPIIRPWRVWHEITTQPTRSQMIAQGRKPGYWDSYEREYGLSTFEGSVHFYYGPQTHDSETTKSKCWSIPWRHWHLVRHSLYDLKGELFAHLPQTPNYRQWPHRWDVERAIEDACPTITFSFLDYDGEELTAKTKIEEREWAFGERRFKWLSLFRRNHVRRSLDIKFSGETGRRKGSWKGGTIGHSIDMLQGELHEAAFRRYCTEHEMTFSGPALQLRTA